MRPLSVKSTVRLTALTAPILLCAVALVQLHAARTTWLTPWKGGGFGMFSTVDSPAVRFLRIALETDRGSVRVAVPPRLQREALRLREAPDARGLRALTEKLAAATWIADESMPAERRYAMMMDAESSRGRPIPHQDAAHSSEAIYRVLGPGESPQTPPLKVSTVCAEVWRYRVEQRTTRLVADRLMQVCVAAR